MERQKISYECEEYECDGFLDGIQVADQFAIDHEIVYKTLVTLAKSGNDYVFVIPIEEEIDFKKAAKVVGEKALEMLHLKDLTKVTGYVRGGCTSIGMKKQYPTFLAQEAQALETVIVSAGRRGLQVELKPTDLQALTQAKFIAVTMKSHSF